MDIGTHSRWELRCDHNLRKSVCRSREPASLGIDRLKRSAGSGELDWPWSFQNLPLLNCAANLREDVARICTNQADCAHQHEQDYGEP